MLEIMVQGLNQKTKSLIQGTLPYKFYINLVDYEINKLQNYKVQNKEIEHSFKEKREGWDREYYLENIFVWIKNI